MTADVIEALDANVTAIAYCWKLTRTDGVVLGFTSHDRDLWIEGVVYRSHPGMVPSAVSLSAGLDADSMDVGGVLDDRSITSEDLECGRWNGAKVEFFAADWERPEAGLLRLMRGTIGDVRRQLGIDGEGTFEVELVSEQAGLSKPSAPRCSPLCRNEFGDRRCGVNVEALAIETLLERAEDGTLMVPGNVEEKGAFAAGKLRVLTGPLSGLDRFIAALDGRALTLDEDLPEAAVPCRVRMWPGCDKRFSTCAGRYNNAAMFNGEPHVPGTDTLIRYGES